MVLSASERAIYLELEHYLRAIDMRVKRNKKSESDREKRLAQALGESRYAGLLCADGCALMHSPQHRRRSSPKAMLALRP